MSGAHNPLGRPPGRFNKISQADIERHRQEGMLPVDFMLRVMRDKSLPKAARLDAAAKAAPYIHPKLAQITVIPEGEGQGFNVVVRRFTDPEAPPLPSVSRGDVEIFEPQHGHTPRATDADDGAPVVTFRGRMDPDDDY